MQTQQAVQPSLISLCDAAARLSISSKTARNWLALGKFPIPTFRLGGLRVVRSSDIDAFISNLGSLEASGRSDDTNPSSEQKKRGRGRPRKSEGRLTAKKGV